MWAGEAAKGGEEHSAQWPHHSGRGRARALGPALRPCEGASRAPHGPLGGAGLVGAGWGGLATALRVKWICREKVCFPGPISLVLRSQAPTRVPGSPAVLLTPELSLLIFWPVALPQRSGCRSLLGNCGEHLSKVDEERGEPGGEGALTSLLEEVGAQRRTSGRR